MPDTAELRRIAEAASAAGQPPYFSPMDAYKRERHDSAWHPATALKALRVIEAAEFAEGKQQEALAIIRNNGFVFDDIGSEPGNWKHLAFTLYTLICEVDSHVTPALAEWRNDADA